MAISHPRFVFGGVPLALLALAAPAAQAQPDVAKSTAATLFQEAKEGMARGDYATACPKLAESHRLDPGGGTLLNLALCRKNQGKTATAWVLYREAATIAAREGNADREAAARAEIAALEPTLSRIVVTVPEPARVPGLVVTLDGVALAPAAWGVATPVDPARVLIRASAEGYAPWEMSFDTSRPTSRTEATVPVLQRAPAGTSPVVPSAGGAAARPRGPESEGDTQRVVGLVVGGVGVAGLVVGGVTGIVALGAQSDADAVCPDVACADQGAVDDNERAHSFATVSNIGFIAGGALLAAGVTVFLLAPSGEAGATSVTGFATVGGAGPSVGLAARFE